jgi:hypothetical protein
MRSFLTINRPWQGTGNRENFVFSGREERALRDCLARLDAFVVPDPSDRWTAAIAVGPSEDPLLVVEHERGYGIEPGVPERAWDIDGALALAELLPAQLHDLREDLVASFSARKEGRPGDGRVR